MIVQVIHHTVAGDLLAADFLRVPQHHLVADIFSDGNVVNLLCPLALLTVLECRAASPGNGKLIQIEHFAHSALHFRKHTHLKPCHQKVRGIHALPLVIGLPQGQELQYFRLAHLGIRAQALLHLVQRAFQGQGDRRLVQARFCQKVHAGQKGIDLIEIQLTLINTEHSLHKINRCAALRRQCAGRLRMPRGALKVCRAGYIHIIGIRIVKMHIVPQIQGKIQNHVRHLPFRVRSAQCRNHAVIQIDMSRQFRQAPLEEFAFFQMQFHIERPAVGLALDVQRIRKQRKIIVHGRQSVQSHASRQTVLPLSEISRALLQHHLAIGKDSLHLDMLHRFFQRPQFHAAVGNPEAAVEPRVRKGARDLQVPIRLPQRPFHLRRKNRQQAHVCIVQLNVQLDLFIIIQFLRALRRQCPERHDAESACPILLVQHLFLHDHLLDIDQSVLQLQIPLQLIKGRALDAPLEGSHCHMGGRIGKVSSDRRLHVHGADHICR